MQPELRYYFKGLRSGAYYQNRSNGFGGKPLPVQEPVRVYLAVDLLYKNVQYKRLNDFLIRSGNVQFIDPARAIYTDIKRVYGFDLKVGSISQSFPNNHLWVETFIGLGARIKVFSYRGIPTGGTAPDRYIQFFTYRSSYSSSHTTLFRLSIPAGVKLVYRF